MSNELENFSTELVYWDFMLNNEKFRLKEALETAHIAYKNVAIQNMKVSEEKGGEFTGGADADAVLVSKCLFKLVEDSKEQPIQLHFVKSLPRKIFTRLYTWIRKNSGMDEEQETEEFLTKRIASDTTKLANLQKAGPMGKGDQPSITVT